MGKRSSSGMATRSSSKANVATINALLNPSDDGQVTDAVDGNDHLSDSGSVKRQSLRIKTHGAAPAVKPKRKRISPEQFKALTELFDQTDTPNYELRDKLAQKLNMTNREVQVWFQNRRAKYNRARQQEQRHQQEMRERQHRWHQEAMVIYPSYQQRWPEEHYHYQQEPSPCESLLSSTSSSSSAASSPVSPYPALSPDMAPLDILAMAADYIQKCDQAEQQAKRRRIEPVCPAPLSPQTASQTTSATHCAPTTPPASAKSWRPWV